ncbi:putative baseplate assembly protein [Nostoc sp. FACHB-152]|uniref:putative baseplate assembly protein n=1 Tax=Nostoc sp. FACHB-152 TaxID=2692837 RepID=UPI001684BC88|nr:putative baseplate assembly protein [Nostoc sp. FACHB-152]MBD2450060.1 putative baseplate assembly protein [Nostoc sp. FACHB-152]
MSAPPKIGSKNFETILQEIQKLVPFYTSEWIVSEHQDSGSALLKIFAHLYTGTLQQLNLVPEKNFIAFLDMLGVKLLPAAQARVPVTFKVSDGTIAPVLIPAKTEVTAQALEGGDSIVFETERNIFATPAKLVDAYSVNNKKDSIFSAPPNFLTVEKRTAFFARLVLDAQQNQTSLFLDNTSEINAGDILKIGEASMLSGFEYVEVDEVSEKKVTIKNRLATSYYTDTLVEKNIIFDLSVGINKQEHILYLGHQDIFNITASVRITLELTCSQINLLGSDLIKWQYCGGCKENKPLEWRDFDEFRVESNNLILDKNNDDEIQEIEINGIKSRWIRYIVNGLSESKLPPINDLQQVKINSIKVTATPLVKDETTPCLSPDMAFYNDVPIDISQDFYPFGKQPRLSDSFYFASQEAFSKKGAPLTLQFKIIQPEEDFSTEIKDPILSWEYWHGTGWNILTFAEEPDKTILNLTKQDGEIAAITFTCPEDIKPTLVNGQQKYWLRVRLVNGIYGRQVTSESISEYRFNPPHLEDFKITYAPSASPLEYCLLLNNLQYKDKTEESQKALPFEPFQALKDEHQSLYLGFDAPPLKGPISIFFSLEIQAYTETNMPRINWEYYRRENGRGEWSRLEVGDGTNNLTQSGTVEFFGSADFAQTLRFGKSLYWIRAVDINDKFQPQEKGLKYTQLTGFAPAPKIKGIYLNTTWVSQTKRIQNEILGSSDGKAEQIFELFKYPAIAEEIWVNELSALSADERKELLDKFSVNEVKDDAGNTREFWIKWEPRNDLIESTSSDRHYEIDQTFGVIKFGNGVEGAVPPIGTNNIRANYQFGGGEQGNVGSFEITSLTSSIAFVDSVTNPEAAQGGSDSELLEQALKRGPQMLKHRNRAVSKGDFEWLTRQASRSVARVKCLPNFNDEKKSQPGWVTVVIVPKSSEAKPQPSLQLRQTVEQYLRNHTANVVTSPKHLHVCGPIYIEIGIQTRLFAAEVDAVPFVDQMVIQKLNAFLHPLAGGYSNQGWQFGRLPCLSDFYGLLGSIPNLDRVSYLSMTVRDTNTNRSWQITPDSSVEINIVPYALVCSGKHIIDVKADINSEVTVG